MTSETIFHKSGPFYYPFTKPLTGNITDLCNNPTNYGCTLNTNYSTTNCGLGSKPVLDCGVRTSAVCCPEKIFPYAKTTKYCTYLNNQGCFKHQTYQWPHGQGLDTQCPSDTYNISECGLCCPHDITSNMNFTSDPYDPLKNNIVGNLWNKDNAGLDDGVYKITINGNCVMNFIGNSMPVLYKNSPNSYPTNQYPGDCGGTWVIKKMTEQYIGNGIYPSSDMKYVPGGYTLYNNISGLYLSLASSQFGHNVTISLSSTPTVVNIFKNSDGSYRIQNAKNQIGSFSGIGNVGNPINCAIIDQNNKFGTYNWENGLSGKPCGINNSPDQNNYKFQFIKVTDVGQANIPATLPNGEYYIEIQDYTPFVAQKSSNSCLDANGIISNYGGAAGTCGTLLPRFGLDKNYKWILINEAGGGFSLQNEVNGNYLQEPVYGKNITTGPDKVVLNIFVNFDNTLRITSTDLMPICLITATVTDNLGSSEVLQGYNWNVNNLECGTGPNATIFNYRFNFVPVPPIVIPPVSDLPNGEGIYEINTGTSEGVLFDQETGGGTSQIQPGCTKSCPIVKNSIPNILEMSSKFSPNGLSEQRWKISKATDNYGNHGYTIQNLASKRYLTLSTDFNQILTSSQNITVLFLYTNSDGSFTIQDKSGACLQRYQQKYADTLFGSGLWNYYYNTFRDKQSANACGLSSPVNNVTYTLKYINPPPTMQNLSGNGGNCTYTWYNQDFSTTVVSGFSDQVTCDTAITVAQQNVSSYNIPIDNVNGSWQPFFGNNGETHILYTYGGKCMSVDDNDNVVASTSCTKNDPNAQSCVTTRDSSGNYVMNCSPAPQVPKKWYWVFTPEKVGDKATGNYFVTNQATGKYLVVPNTASTNSLTTTSTPTTIGIRLTYPSFGSTASTNRLSPTSYYFHFVSPSAEQVCAYTNNTVFQSITWGSNTGLVSGYPTPPIEQQQRGVMYECGTDPNKFTTTGTNYGKPNPNYQFTVDGYCLTDFMTNSYDHLCFHDDGTSM
jgi:hypothetical protein